MPFEKGKSGNNKTTFKKGESGNPAGRPRKLPDLDRLLADVLGSDPDNPQAKSKAEEVLEALIKKAKAGNVQAQIAVLDRAYGKPKQTLSNDPENPFDGGGITLVFNTEKIEPVTSEAAMQAIFDKFKEE